MNVIIYNGSNVQVDCLIQMFLGQLSLVYRFVELLFVLHQIIFKEGGRCSIGILLLFVRRNGFAQTVGQVHVTELAQVFVGQRNDSSIARMPIKPCGWNFVIRDTHERIHPDFFHTVITDSRRLGDVVTSNLKSNRAFVKTSR
jgi:hypothetical protein